MNENFKDIIKAKDRERLGVFLDTANLLGTAVQNVEKDFWVCWTLDALFNGLKAGGPRLLFKGGTSLSKAFGLITRFSEDIDITVFRDDIGQPAEPADLENLSGKQRRRRLDAILEASQAHIQGNLMAQLHAIATDYIPKGFTLDLDPEDRDGQTLLLGYPVVTERTDQYIRSAVKIEAGAKSALDPHTAATVKPYISDVLKDLRLDVPNVTTVQPERTFWDKIMILHGLRQWFERRAVIRHGGQRVSRHYYDVHLLMRDARVSEWIGDRVLAEDCARHARLFFGSPDQSLDLARPGSFRLMPPPAMIAGLRQDYAAMAGMIFHDIPPFDEVLVTIERVETEINRLPTEG